MRKLIVSNFVTLDGYYEGKDKTFDGFFDNHHDDYKGDDAMPPTQTTNHQAFEVKEVAR
jgi:hypothetical protein